MWQNGTIEGSTGANAHAQSAAVTATGTLTALAGRNQRYKSVYKAEAFDCRTGGGVAAAKDPRKFRASALVSLPQHRAGAQLGW